MKLKAGRILSYAKLSVVSSLLLGVFVVSPVFAQETVSRSYISTDTNIQPGMAVRLDTATGSEYVGRAAFSDAKTYVGIVTTIEDSLLTSADGGNDVYVASGGDVDAYVSDVNGPVEKGDFVSLSPLRGVLMKADSSVTDVVGIALESFNAENTTNTNISTTSGGTQEVSFKKLKVTLQQQKVASVTKNDSFFIAVGSALVGKEVGLLQVAVAFIIFFILLVIEGSIIYGAIYSSTLSIGRNPLSRNSIYKQLIRVGLLALGVLVVGMAVVYGVLSF